MAGEYFKKRNRQEKIGAKAPEFFGSVFAPSALGRFAGEQPPVLTAAQSQVPIPINPLVKCTSARPKGPM